MIHAASTVSFDPPIDDAFRTNVKGVLDLYEALHAAGGTPHVVHVSTAYVAGARKGVVPEEPLDHDADWRTELAAALAARADVERDSRRPEVLRKALAEAGREHGKAGPQSVAAAAEEARQEWVDDQLVEYGRLRAQSLGWPDVYTFTKALGERVAEERLTGDGAAVRGPPGDRGERAAPPLPGLDRRLQDGRSADHRLRPRHPARVPRPAGRRARHDPGRHGGQRDPGGGRRPAAGRPAGLLPRRLRLA